MKIFNGIDIIEMSRFRRLKEFNRVSEFVLSAREIELMNISRDRCQFLASRFALKEAVIKAIPEPINLDDLEILTLGIKPEINFLKKLLIEYSLAVSLSHTENIIVASAVAYYK